MADEGDLAELTDNGLADAAGELAAEDKRDVLEYLRHRSVPCPLCGYNLRALTVPRCPECGRGLRLSIGLTEPFMRAWIALAFVEFATSGISLLMGVGFMVDRTGWPENDFPGSVALLYLLVSPLGSIAVIGFRRRILRLASAIQWIMAVIALALTVLTLVVAITHGL